MALSDFRKHGYLSIIWRLIDFGTSRMDTLYKSHYETSNKLTSLLLHLRWNAEHTAQTQSNTLLLFGPGCHVSVKTHLYMQRYSIS